MDKNDVIIIQLDRPRVLWFGHKALKTLSAMGSGLLDKVTDGEGDKLDMDAIEKIMYCGLLKDAKLNNEILTLEQMEDLLDLIPFSEVVKKMTEALQSSFGDISNDPNVQRMATKTK